MQRLPLYSEMKFFYMLVAFFWTVFVSILLFQLMYFSRVVFFYMAFWDILCSPLHTKSDVEISFIKDELCFHTDGVHMEILDEYPRLFLVVH